MRPPSPLGKRVHPDWFNTGSLIFPKSLPGAPVLAVEVFARWEPGQEPQPFATFHFREDQRGRRLTFNLRPPFGDGSLSVRSDPLRGDAAILYG